MDGRVGRAGKAERSVPPPGRSAPRRVAPSMALRLGLAACGAPEANADPQVVLPQGLPVQVRPTYPEPGLPLYNFQGGQYSVGTPSGAASPPSGSGMSGSLSGQASAAASLSSLGSDLSAYQSYVGSYYGPNQECVSLTRYFDASLPPSSEWQKGELVAGATDIQPGTPIATFNFGSNYGPADSPGGASGVSHTGIYLGQDSTGVLIFDQWSGSGGASIHTIPWSAWGGNTAEAGDKYYTIQ